MENCDVLSISDDGEGVLVWKAGDCFVAIKIRTFSNCVDADDAYEAYYVRLCEETCVEGVVDSALCINETVWRLRLLTLTNLPVKYVLYADAFVDGTNCVVESQFLQAADYVCFMQDFPVFVRSLSFGVLQRKSSHLDYNQCSVTVSSISDVSLHRGNCKNVLLFVGKNKYFTVAVSDKSQLGVIEKAVSDGRLRKILNDACDGFSHTRYLVIDEEYRVSGTLEFISQSIDGVYVDVFGYWAYETDSGIDNNLIIKLGRGNCT